MGLGSASRTSVADGEMSYPYPRIASIGGSSVNPEGCPPKVSWAPGRAFDLIVRFKSSPRPNQKSSAALLVLPDNIAAALRHWDRICEIDLGVSRASAGPIVEVIHEPASDVKG